MTPLEEDSPPEPTDSLTTVHVRRARTGDRQSSEWLIGRFHGLLHAQARLRLATHPSLKGILEPEDLVNDVWLITLRRLPELSARSGRYTGVLVRFLGGTLLNVYRAALRRYLPNSHALGADADHVAEREAPTLDAIGIAEQSEVHRQLVEVLTTLPELDRLLLVRRILEDVPYADLATESGLRIGAVRVRCHRALARLRQHLGASLAKELQEVADGAY